MMIRKMILLYI